MEEGPAAVADDALREKLRETISNTKLSERFLALARDLDVMEPRAPDDVRPGLACLPFPSFVPEHVVSRLCADNNCRAHLFEQHTVPTDCQALTHSIPS